MASSTQLYTWQTPKGTLSLVHNTKNYELSLCDKNQTIQKIYQHNIQAFLSNVSASQAEKICQEYFPFFQGSNDSLTVTFHLSAVPEGKAETIASPQASKGLDFILNDLETKKRVNFSSDAPFYRRVCQGLNLQGSCKTPTCDAFKKVVFIPKGLGNFNIAKEVCRAPCPACDKTLGHTDVNNIGFWNCKYTIDGSREGKEVLKTDIAGREHYTTFKTGNEVTWNYLEVKVEKA